jgi:hypothetical protein
MLPFAVQLAPRPTPLPFRHNFVYPWYASCPADIALLLPAQKIVHSSPFVFNLFRTPFSVSPFVATLTKNTGVYPSKSETQAKTACHAPLAAILLPSP